MFGVFSSSPASVLGNPAELRRVLAEIAAAQPDLAINELTGWVESVGDATNIGSPDNPSGLYPDFVKIANGFGIKARQVMKREDLRAAMREMQDHDGPYLLDVIVHYTEHVLPFIPQKKSAMEILTK